MPAEIPPDPRPPGLFRRLGRWSDRMLLRSVPEYHLFDSEERRIRGIKELDTDLENSKSFWRAMMVIWITLTVVANASMCLVPMLLPWALPGRVPIAIGLQVALAVAITLWIWRNGIKTRLREKLIQQGVPVCRACRYCLRGLPAGQVQCPECGRATEADVVNLLSGPPGL